MSYIAYCLIQQSVMDGNGSNGHSATYVGSTNNFGRRIRQHNGEIVGGAKMTTRVSSKGGTWLPIMYAKGFGENHREALSFEWHWQNESKKFSKIRDPIERREKSIDKILVWPRFSHIVKVHVNENENSN